MAKNDFRKWGLKSSLEAKYSKNLRGSSNCQTCVLTDNFDNFDTHPENALPEGVWYWRVRGENADGPSAWSETWTLTVDVTRPTVQISVNTSLIFDNYVGTDNFVVTATFSENMDNTVPIDVEFTPDTLTLENRFDNWIVDNSVLEIIYDVVDNNVNIVGVDIRVENGEDLAGNLLVENAPADMFSIDTQNPTVVSVAPSDTLITDADVGPGAFQVTIVFSENMDEAVNPDLLFHTPDNGGTLSSPSYSWTDNLTCVVTYDVADAGVNRVNIDILVENA